jgi:hypothetical protein
LVTDGKFTSVMGWFVPEIGVVALEEAMIEIVIS